MRKKGTKIDYKRTTLVGFAALYIVSMLLSTYLIKCRYVNAYNDKMYEVQDELVTTFGTADKTLLADMTEEGRESLKSMAYLYLSNMLLEDKCQQISGAVYDMNGELLADSSNVFGFTGLWVSEGEWQERITYYPLEEYLTEEEIMEIASYFNTESWSVISEDNQETEHPDLIRYSFMSFFSEENMDEPWKIEVWEKKSTFVPDVGGWTNEEITTVWEWMNEDLSEPEKEQIFHHEANVFLPYISQGIKNWEQWRQDSWLQGFEDYDVNKTAEAEQTEKDGLIKELFTITAVGKQKTGMCKLVLRQTAHPWIAAMDYMKYVYILGAVLTLICMMFVRKSLDKAYMEQVKYENLRHIFTGTAVNELNAPLSEIRTFAVELKNGDYIGEKEKSLNRMIASTEQMDDLVRKMILVSKLDEEDLEQYQGLR